jgi:glycosyltransferase involved in cell wall biosynthesis
MDTSVSVGLFNDSFTPIIDGVTLTVRNYAYWLNRILGPACVVAPSAPFHREIENFPVLRFFSIPTFVHPPYRIGLPRLDPGLRARIKKLEFSLVHAHSPFGAGRMALRIARESGVPIIATFHSKFRDNLRLAIPFERVVEREIRRIVDFFHSVDQVWVPGRSVELTLREYGYQGRCEVVENGIDYDAPGDITVLRGRGAGRLGVAEDELVGLFVGQHILEKNLEFLVRALPSIMEESPQFRMVFVGGGCARRYLESLVRKSSAAGRTRFFGPIEDRAALAEIYARADIFLLPSLWDNAPLVIREAAAFSTPSVLLRGSTAAEVIRDGENGFLADADENSFVECVVRALHDRDKLERVGSEARRTLCRSWEDVVREVRDRYLDVLSRRVNPCSAVSGVAS